MATFNVSSAGELTSALNAAAAGDTIVAAAGTDFGTYTFSGRSYASDITITSADPQDPGVFQKKSDVSSCAHIVFDNLLFNYTYGGESSTYYVTLVSNSDYITYQNCTFDGDDHAGGFPNAFGIRFTGCSEVTLDTIDLSGFHRGIKVYQTDGFYLVDSEIHHQGGDHMSVSQSDNVEILRNFFHSHRTATDDITHRDTIQFTNLNSSWQENNILIADNEIQCGEGGFTQSIYMRNEAADNGGGTNIYRRNITIRNNLIYARQTHAITVGQCIGCLIEYNTILQIAGDPSVPQNAAQGSNLQVPEIGVHPDAQDVTIRKNIVDNIREAPASAAISGMVYITQADHEDVFVPSSLSADANWLYDFEVLEGGDLDGVDAGSDLLGSAAPITLPQMGALTLRLVAS